MPNRVAIFVDGFNLFYSAKAAKAKWLNIIALIEGLLRQEDQIVQLHYFTAMVDGVGDPDRPRRQQVYLRALKADPRVYIHYGTFLNKTIDRPIERLSIADNIFHLSAQQFIIPPGTYNLMDTRGNVRQLPVYEFSKQVPILNHPVPFARVHTREEKGSDVNLAVQMLHRAWLNEYDQAILISNDSDLCEPIRLIKKELNKNVTVCYVAQDNGGRTVSSRLSRVASGVLHINWQKLRQNQFSQVVTTQAGKSVTKPNSW